MFKSLIYTSTLIAASQAFADPVSFDVLADLPTDVAYRVIELEAHGDRFERAILAIIVEAARAEWLEGCSPGETPRKAFELPGV